MNERSKKIFTGFQSRGYQIIYLTFEQFKEVLDICKSNGVETFYYTPVTRGFSLDTADHRRKYFGEFEFTYEDGIHCLDKPTPKIFENVKLQFHPSKKKAVVKGKKETKQVTF